MLVYPPPLHDIPKIRAAAESGEPGSWWPRAARPGLQLAGNLRGLHTPGILNCIQNSAVNQLVTLKAYFLYTL